MYLCFIELPKIVGKLDNATVNEGQEVRFTVKFSGKPRPIVKWFREEEEIIITEEYEIIETEDSVTLIIKSAKPAHAGNYSAQLTNLVGTATTNKALLTLNGPPVFVQVPEPLAPTNKDESVRLECIVEAIPKPTISWLINGKELTTKDGVQIEKDVNNNKYALVIPKLNSTTHSGVLTIKASNTIGTAQHEMIISVLGMFLILTL